MFRSELADDPSFMRNFEAERSSMAGLDHPRIVATLDRWRQPGAAYVTMPVFESNLQARLDRGSLPLDDALRVIDHVAEALGAAHRAGVVHGNVKPTNVLLDADGNAFLADFAISTPVDRCPTVFSRRTGGGVSLTTQADVSSLMVGRPDPAVRRRGWVALRGIRRCVRRDRCSNADRASDPETFALDLRQALGVRPGGQPVARIENPYVGLQAFQERDARRFFGRERLVERLLARLGRTGVQGRLIVLVGPSGAGKSSVIRAGVLPGAARRVADRRRSMVPSDDDPGRRPVRGARTGPAGCRNGRAARAGGATPPGRHRGDDDAPSFPSPTPASCWSSTSSKSSSPTPPRTMRRRSSTRSPHRPRIRTRRSRSSPRCAPTTTTAQCSIRRSVSCSATPAS